MAGVDDVEIAAPIGGDAGRVIERRGVGGRIVECSRRGGDGGDDPGPRVDPANQLTGRFREVEIAVGVERDCAGGVEPGASRGDILGAGIVQGGLAGVGVYYSVGCDDAYSVRI